MNKINNIVQWAKNYPNWTKKDYIKAAIVVVLIVMVVGSIL
jgi:hypothetical protein|tara:strand:- start:315 stop:437 length:123 start_codon:yes stop_codon:yes gene_type:complete